MIDWFGLMNAQTKNLLVALKIPKKLLVWHDEGSVKDHDK